MVDITETVREHVGGSQSHVIKSVNNITNNITVLSLQH